MPWRAMPERLRGVITTRRYTNPHFPLPLPLDNSWLRAVHCIEVTVALTTVEHLILAFESM